MWFLLLLKLFDSTLGARAQTTNATCSNDSNTSWLFSPSGDSPCLTWSKLQSLCLSSDKYINVPPLLDASWGYNSPDQGGSECQCNSVAYSLMAGCTFCQIGQSGNWADEGTFSASCQDYISDGVGMGVDLQLPAYVWREWDGTHWDPAAASSSASSFTAFPTQTYSTTLSRAFTTSSSQTSTSTSTSTSTISTTSTRPTASSTSSHKGPIIGGIVGGVIALILLFVIIIYRVRIRNRHSTSAATNEKVFNLTPKDKVTTSTSTTSYRSPSSPRSFLDIIGSSTSLIGVPKSESRRQTELIADPRSFSSPRPAPTPTPTPTRVRANHDNLKYTTTSERMRTQTEQEDEDDGQEILRKLPPVDGGLVVYDSPEEDFEYEREEREEREFEDEAKVKVKSESDGKTDMKKKKSIQRDMGTEIHMGIKEGIRIQLEVDMDTGIVQLKVDMDMGMGII
ncbi:hypothetical protein BCR39DRAFT_588889 [Naematelia encephala]|uniref:Cyanovirin-N domain-containing protein n=1 Tax=Naematelia encephala TaxID=71784 RepID=A0A1Y2AZK0_9TREE|nr:hypothetical protein BCR39DRAFT_588889 [Naematelia encephala]